MKFILACILISLHFLSIGQSDTVVLLKGRQMLMDVESISDSTLFYRSYLKNNGKKVEKSGYIGTYRVFSVTQNGQRSILYKQDSLIGNYRTVDQMHSYILGESHAFDHYNPKLAFYGGIVLGVGVTLLDTYLPQRVVDPGEDHGFFKSSPSLIPLATTFLYTVTLGIPEVSLRASSVKNRVLLQDLDFLDGYSRTAKMKRVMGGLKGKVLGVVLGLGTYFIFQ